MKSRILSSENLATSNTVRCLYLLIGTLMFFGAGCGSDDNPKGPTGTSMQGTWTVTGNIQCTQSCGSSGSNTYQVALVSSPCTVTTPVGMFSVQGSACFIANNNTGEGSISGTGIPNSPKSTGQGVLIGVPSNPVPDNAIINMLFVAGENNGNFAEFTGSGSVANGKMTGTGSCSPSTPICQGVSATFSGNKQ